MNLSLSDCFFFLEGLNYIEMLWGQWVCSCHWCFLSSESDIHPHAAASWLGCYLATAASLSSGGNQVSAKFVAEYAWPAVMLLKPHMQCSSSEETITCSLLSSDPWRSNDSSFWKLLLCIHEAGFIILQLDFKAWWCCSKLLPAWTPETANRTSAFPCCI